VHQLDHDVAALGVHGVGNRLPAGDLLVGVDAGRVEVALPTALGCVPSVMMRPAPARCA